MTQLKVKFLMGAPECNDIHIPDYSKQFIEELSKVSGIDISYGEMDEVAAQPLPVYFIASGGAEEGFKANHVKTSEPYILLTTPGYNSLAASMEIMGYLQEHNLKGEILHGDMQIIADRLKVLLKVAEARNKLAHAKLGCFGLPGGLIASDANFDLLKEKYNIEFKMFELDELIEEYHKGGYPENEYTKNLKAKAFNLEEVEKALNVYGALKRLIAKYELTGVTVRCFTLLNAIHTTGCLALAILNAEGIAAACEGDQKSLLTMAVSEALTGSAGFMANPSCMDPKTKEIIYAHCTIPMDMCDDYNLTTHFESGIGVAVACDIKPQEVTIFKTNEDLSKYHAEIAELKETMHKNTLCRSQMRLYLPSGTKYFSKNPISNHHIIVKGNYKELFDEFFNQIGSTEIN